MFNINTNNWNKIRYTIYTPVYDFILSHFQKSRKLSIDSLIIKPGSKILIIGAGTGLDLEFLPDNCQIVATDITPAMVARIQKRSKKLKRNVIAMEMDGQALNLPNNSFDIVILHLILAVIPKPKACIAETKRVLKPEGQVIVFDKFRRSNRKASILRQFFNVFTNIFFTNINRKFEELIDPDDFTVVSDRNANFKGNFRLIRMVKN
jgi:phosphatidylethanolamine/phosphatidyl-N-methylethanolamine N-methyltransferase